MRIDKIGKRLEGNVTRGDNSDRPWQTFVRTVNYTIRLLIYSLKDTRWQPSGSNFRTL